MKKITLIIACGINADLEPVSGYQLTDHFGIWRKEPRGKWSMTHIPSGYAVQFGKLDELRAMATELERLKFNWSSATPWKVRGYKTRAIPYVKKWRARHARELVQIS